MASLDSEAIMGVWGWNPQQRFRGRVPVVGGSWAKPAEAECPLYFACPKEAANLSHY